MCILGLRIVLMYELCYHFVKNNNCCGNNSRLLFTDTDRLMYEIKTEGAYVLMKILIKTKIFDIDNYSTKSKFYDDSNKLVVGKMKNETASVAIKYNLLD